MIVFATVATVCLLGVDGWGSGVIVCFDRTCCFSSTWLSLCSTQTAALLLSYTSLFMIAVSSFILTGSFYLRCCGNCWKSHWLNCFALTCFQAFRYSVFFNTEFLKTFFNLFREQKLSCRVITFFFFFKQLDRSAIPHRDRTKKCLPRINLKRFSSKLFKK